MRFLLGSGADPNRHHDTVTAFEVVLSDAVEASHNTSIDGLQRCLEHRSLIVEDFIKHDANPKANRNSPLGSRIREAFGKHAPDRARSLEAMIKRSHKKWLAAGKISLPKLPADWFESFTRSLQLAAPSRLAPGEREISGYSVDPAGFRVWPRPSESSTPPRPPIRQRHAHLHPVWDSFCPRADPSQISPLAFAYSTQKAQVRRPELNTNNESRSVASPGTMHSAQIGTSFENNAYEDITSQASDSSEHILELPVHQNEHRLRLQAQREALAHQEWPLMRRAQRGAMNEWQPGSTSRNPDSRRGDRYPMGSGEERNSQLPPGGDEESADPDLPSH